MSLPDYVLKGAVRRALGRFGAIITTGINTKSVATGLTASTTQTRVGGLALTKAINRLTTVANANDAVTLPALSAGQTVVVLNDGANAAKVFPNLGTDTIDGGSAGASVPLTATKRCAYICISAGVIVSAQFGVVSA